MDDSDVISDVKDQYEALPYPPRDPEKERTRVIRTVGDTLCALNHHCFKGQRDFTKGFRVLVAGGGTGDAAIYLGEQLRGTSAEIVYMDISEASRSIAEKRALVRGLTNITWMTESLLSLPDLDVGQFDYINCSGVLHHLHEPEAGLQALHAVLGEQGAIFLMLYARHGRQAVYQMQSLFREMMPPGVSIEEKARIARRVIDALPRDHAFLREYEKWAFEISPEGYGDAGLYDLLLHSVDRSYDIDEIYDFAATAKLEVVKFLGPQGRFYNPDNIIEDQKLRLLLEDKSEQERQAIAEKLFSNHIKHQFYLSRDGACTASIEDEENVLILTKQLEDQNLALHQALKPGRLLTIEFKIAEDQESSQLFQLMGNEVNKACFEYMDGKTPIRELVQHVHLKTGVSAQKVKAELQTIFDILHPRDWVFLRRL